MPLPPAYSHLLNQLNKDVLQQQPQDPLQFCANWFNHKLQLERTHLITTVTPHEQQLSLQARPYTFGTQSHPMDLEPPSPFSRQHEPQPSYRAPPPPDQAPLRPAPARQERDHSDDEDEEVDDPRDNPNYLNDRAGDNKNQNYDQGGIPSTYNLGRRTSVSAESLDPSAISSNLPKTIIPKTPSQRKRIENSISNNLLFRNLDEDQHTDVINAMKEISVSTGIEVIVQGAVGDFFYVVEKGTFEVWVRPAPTHTYAGPGQPTKTMPGVAKKVAGYGPGGSFGELALMYNAPRAATVIATSPATMWALDRVTFRSILMQHTSRKRKMYENFLSSVEILGSLTVQERSKIADALEEKVYEEGENVVVEGEVGKNFYIVESGTAQVLMRREGDRVLKVYTKGGYFGGQFRSSHFRDGILTITIRRTRSPQCRAASSDRSSSSRPRTTPSSDPGRESLYATPRTGDRHPRTTSARHVWESQFRPSRNEWSERRNGGGYRRGGDGR